MKARYHALPDSVRASLEALGIVSASLTAMFGAAFGGVAILLLLKGAL